MKIHPISAICLSVLIAALIIALFGCGSRGYDVFGPSEPREIQVAAVIEGRCAQLGLDVLVTFTDHHYLIDCMDGTICPAAMWVYPGEVVVWRGALKYEDERIDAWARHECCHVLEYANGYPPNEEWADRCAEERF